MFKNFLGGTSAEAVDKGRFLNTGKRRQGLAHGACKQLFVCGLAAPRACRSAPVLGRSELPSNELTAICDTTPRTLLRPRTGALRGSATSRLLLIFASLALLILGGTGCRTVSVRIPPANLKEPGWTVHQGQAVWHIPRAGGREIAGEVLVATRLDGRAFVQFTKSPFPLVIAQASSEAWAVEFPPQNKHYSGRGAPPKRIIWLYLPRVLEGKAPPKGWTWKEDSSGWRLANPGNGEFIEGYFE